WAAWRGLVAPATVLSGTGLPPLAVRPGDAEVRRGSEVRVFVRAPLRDGVVVHWQVAGDVARTLELPVRGDSAAYVFESVRAPISYRVVAPDGAESPSYRLTPVDPLLVTDVTVGLSFPPYLERPPEVYRGDIPPLVVPVGTAVEIEGRASRPVSLAEITADDAVVATLVPEGSTFRGGWTPERGGEYGWRFLDDAGEPASLLPALLRVTLVPDSAPRIRIVVPAPDTLLPATLRQPLVLEAEDDHGLRTLELVAWRVTALGDTLPARTQAVTLDGSPSLLVRPVLDVSEWGLLPGDRVLYYARVRDVHPVGQSGRTPVHTLRMPSAEALRRRAQEELAAAAEELESLRGEAARSAEEMRARDRAARAPDRTGAESSAGDEASPSFQQQEAVRQALADQAALGARADSLQAGLSELARTLQEAGAADTELADDLRELQALLQEMGGEALQERLEELLARMEAGGGEDTREALDALAEGQERLRQQLEEALERARRAAVEQEFRSAAGEAQELAETQRALAESMAEEERGEGRAVQQDALAQETRALQERMEQLAERLAALGEDRAEAGLESARASARQAESAMEQAARAAERSPRDAAGSAQAAAERMEAAAQELQQAQQQLMAERADAFQQALGRTAQDALALAREQARAREAMEGATRDQMAGLRGDLAAVQQGIRALAENLALAARMAGADARDLSRRMGEAMTSMEEAFASLDQPGRGRPPPQAAAETAVEALNQVARSALDAARALEEGGATGQPTPEEMMERMEQMAQQQAEVNNQAAQMVPMQLSPQAMQEMMEQLAAGQEQVASDLGEMARQEGEDGPLGDVEAFAREAQALAQALAGGRLDAETRARQERLFHRLLDAGRGLEREEESTEREALAPGAFEAVAPPPLTDAALGLSRFRLPDAETLNRLPPAARALVRQYFLRLNRGGGGGAP
ncbi:MAG: hypothetical protein RQ751_13690, partial [Longimicrobiales bacterium]|nr:hypothetical protein [Longimicrobiales bacterium]